MKIAICGYGIEGQSSYDYFNNDSNEIVICDERTDINGPIGAVTRLGEDSFNNLNEFDLIVRSAGLPPYKLLDTNTGIKDKITSQLNLFLSVCSSPHIIGITGTKGKGTTSSLVFKMLEASNKQVVLGGNIGVPMLDLLKDINSETNVVLELSSFQLIDLKEKSPSLAICLMVMPEHLNWHKDLSEYIEAKSQLFIHQSGDDTTVYFADNELSSQIALKSPGQHIPYFKSPGAYVDIGKQEIKIDDQVICKTSELKLLGAHNWQNVCAAITTVWQIDKNVEAIKSVVTAFSGLEYRLELVGEINGVKYYDDSFGTTPETAMVAIEAFSSPEVIIVGGSDKGVLYDSLIETILGNNVKSVICIGETGPRIYEMLEARKGFKELFLKLIPGKPSMNDIVMLAKDQASPGDIVLLSTASASFDMFKNYKDRGEQFKTSVQSLAKAA
jgi:UDP-N-acetylmuramoylalanine--D-glutamate ligase